MAKIKQFYRIQTQNSLPFYAVKSRGDRLWRIEGTPWHGYNVTSEFFTPGEVNFLPPVLPSQIIGIGLNYLDHIKELDHTFPEDPVIFFKSITSLTGPGGAIRLPSQSKRVDYEAELAIIIGKKTWQVSESDAEQHIAGYTCLNDVTARDLQKKDGQWCRAKSFSTFCPVGPGITQGVDPQKLRIRLFQNGTLRQDSNTSQLLFPPAQLVSFISQVMPLYPADIIATGTPSGIGPMQKGDTIEIEIEDVGRLINNVG